MTDKECLERVIAKEEGETIEELEAWYEKAMSKVYVEDLLDEQGNATLKKILKWAEEKDK